MNKIIQAPYLLLLIVGVLIITYIISDKIFIQCKYLNACQPIESENVSQVPSLSALRKKEAVNANSSDKDQIHLKNIGETTNSKIAELEPNEGILLSKENDLKEAKKDLLKTVIKINNAEAEITNANANTASNTTATNTNSTVGNTTNSTAANTNSAAKNLEALKKEEVAIEARIKNLEKERDKYTADRKVTVDEIAALRRQTGDRYAYRMSWVFLNGVFLVLCIAAFVIGGLVIKDSTGADYKKWFVAVIILTVIIPALIFLFNYFSGGETYMSLISPILNQSIAKFGDISLTAISFFNVLGFAGVIVIVFAASAVFKKVGEKNEGEDFTNEKRNIKAILYVGALMLFVGVMRMKLGFDWHLLFVSSDVNDVFYKAAAEFYKTPIAVQAGFYTILLMLIYLPVAYAISEKEPKPADGQNSKNFLQNLGIPVTAEAVFKVIAVLMPALAAPLIGLLKTLFGVA